jgi:hypothetical protein
VQPEDVVGVQEASPIDDHAHLCWQRIPTLLCDHFKDV